MAHDRETRFETQIKNRVMMCYYRDGIKILIADLSLNQLFDTKLSVSLWLDENKSTDRQGRRQRTLGIFFHRVHRRASYQFQFLWPLIRS